MNDKNAGERSTDVSIPVPWSNTPINIHGLGSIALMQLLVMFAMVYNGYEQNKAMRELSCLIAQEPAERKIHWSMCKSYAEKTSEYK